MVTNLKYITESETRVSGGGKDRQLYNISAFSRENFQEKTTILFICVSLTKLYFRVLFWERIAEKVYLQSLTIYDPYS